MEQPVDDYGRNTNPSMKWYLAIVSVDVRPRAGFVRGGRQTSSVLGEAHGLPPVVPPVVPPAVAVQDDAPNGAVARPERAVAPVVVRQPYSRDPMTTVVHDIGWRPARSHTPARQEHYDQSTVNVQVVLLRLATRHRFHTLVFDWCAAPDILPSCFAGPAVLFADEAASSTLKAFAYPTLTGTPATADDRVHAVSYVGMDTECLHHESRAFASGQPLRRVSLTDMDPTYAFVQLDAMWVDYAMQASRARAAHPSDEMGRHVMDTAIQDTAHDD